MHNSGVFPSLPNENAFLLEQMLLKNPMLHSSLLDSSKHLFLEIKISNIFVLLSEYPTKPIITSMENLKHAVYSIVIFWLKNQYLFNLKDVCKWMIERELRNEALILETL